MNVITRRRSVVIGPAILAALSVAGTASAFMRTTGSGSGSAATSTLKAPTAVTGNTSTKVVSWSQSNTSATPPSGFVAQRSTTTGTRSWVQACTAASGATSCIDTAAVATTDTFVFRVIATLNGAWSATSAESATPITYTVVAAPAASQPTSVVITNAVNSAYINSSNVANIGSSVVIPTSIAGDVIRVTASDGVPAHNVVVTQTVGTTSATSQTIPMPSMNLTGLNEGALNTLLSAVVERTNAPDSTARSSASYNKDTVAPILTALQMFDGNGSTTSNGRIDKVTATFGEALASYTASTTPWSLANVPSGGTLLNVVVSSPTVTLTLTEGTGSIDTAVGTFTVAMGTNSNGVRDAAGNQASFIASSPADKAGPVALTIVSANCSPSSNAGKAEPNDTVTISYSEALLASTVPTSSSVVLSAVTGNSGPVSLAMPGLAASSLQIGKTANYLTKNSADVNFNNSPVSKLSATQIRITLGVASGSGTLTVGTYTPGDTGSYTPATSLTDTAGNQAAGALAITNGFF